MLYHPKPFSARSLVYFRQIFSKISFHFKPLVFRQILNVLLNILKKSRIRISVPPFPTTIYTSLSVSSHFFTGHLCGGQGLLAGLGSLFHPPRGDRTWAAQVGSKCLFPLSHPSSLGFGIFNFLIF